MDEAEIWDGVIGGADPSEDNRLPAGPELDKLMRRIKKMKEIRAETRGMGLQELKELLDAYEEEYQKNERS